ncbi:MAG: hypothetical protein P4L69_03915 [Desulfosporosinus sp.]|nr:hypothetical protein [Desulfosporosinus sp.]
MSVGILCQHVLNKTVRHAELPVPSVRMALLFYEFFDRYKEWKIAKRQESIGKLIVSCLGLCILFIPWFLPDIGLKISFVVLILFCFATWYYFEVHERVSHLYVNVHILHHHLIGKLEVGFCDHEEPCHCAENFRCYVLENYNIILDKGSLR